MDALISMQCNGRYSSEQIAKIDFAMVVRTTVNLSCVGSDKVTLMFHSLAVVICNKSFKSFMLSVDTLIHSYTVYSLTSVHVHVIQVQTVAMEFIINLKYSN